MSFRNYLTGTVFAVLLIWGPIDHSWPAWLVIRIGYLVLVPLMVWLLVKWAWSYWQPIKKTEVILERILSGIIVITLVVLAVLEAISKTHFGNTQVIRTRDGLEDVGDYIVLDGPDWSHVFILGFIAILVLWFGVIKRGAIANN